MKLTLGRGNQFFKKPVFTVPKSFAVNTFSSSKKHVKNAFNNLANLPKTIGKVGKK